MPLRRSYRRRRVMRAYRPKSSLRLRRRRLFSSQLPPRKPQSGGSAGDRASRGGVRGQKPTGNRGYTPKQLEELQSRSQVRQKGGPLAVWTPKGERYDRIQGTNAYARKKLLQDDTWFNKKKLKEWNKPGQTIEKKHKKGVNPYKVKPRPKSEPKDAWIPVRTPKSSSRDKPKSSVRRKPGWDIQQAIEQVYASPYRVRQKRTSTATATELQNMVKRKRKRTTGKSTQYKTYKKPKGTIIESPFRTTSGGEPVLTQAKTQTTKKKKKSGGNGSMQLHPGTHYRHEITIGKSPSKALSMLAKINGTATEVQNDSEKDSGQQPGQLAFFTNRDFQHLDFGFNQKLFVCLPLGKSNTLEGIYNKCGFDDTGNNNVLETERDSKTQYYASILETFREFKLHNSNTYHAMRAKFSVIGLKNKFARNTDLMNNTFNLVNVNQDRFRLPANMQLSNTTTQDSGLPSEQKLILLDPKAQPFAVTGFKNSYFVAHQWSKRLGPNDTLQLRLTSKYRSGINLYDVGDRQSRSIDGTTSPLDYFLVVELVGPQCEVIERTSATETNPRIGTAPGWSYYEVKDGIKYVSGSITTADDPESTAETIHGRWFKQKDTLDVKIANIDSANITADPTDDTVGNAYVPVVSDKLQTTEFPKAQRKPD